jgi:hypothetical protein
MGEVMDGALRFVRGRYLISALLVALAIPTKTTACSIEVRPMTDEERAVELAEYKREFVKRAKVARGILEVKAITTSGERISGGLFEVRQVYKGKYRKWMTLELKTVPASMCGAGGAKRNERGIIIISADEPKLFRGFLGPNIIKLLQDEGVLPIKL